MPNEISVTMGLTKNTGNFENIKIDASLTKVVEDVHDEDEWAKVWAEVDAQLETKLLEIVNVKPSK